MGKKKKHGNIRKKKHHASFPRRAFKKQKRHLSDHVGAETSPSEGRELNQKRYKVLDEEVLEKSKQVDVSPSEEASSDSEVESTPVDLLLETFSGSKRKNTALSSESETESEVNDEEDDAAVNHDEGADEKLDQNTESGDEDEESDAEGEVALSPTDPFVTHFEKEFPEDDNPFRYDRKKNETLMWPCLKQLTVLTYELENAGKQDLKIIKDFTLLQMKTTLLKNIPKCVKKCQKSESEFESLNDLQMEILSVIGRYKDFWYKNRTFENGESIRLVYCLHSLNHVLKTRSRILLHNAKMSKRKDDTADYRDQGLTRPKVLIVLPFKEAALRVVNMLIELLFADEVSNVMNKKRFQTEFSSEESDPSKKLKRPDDYEALFAGNTDDNFRVGIKITKKSLKLYANFYSSDIIIVSPLGLRMIIGAEGEKDRDFDFLSSIEVLIMDQVDVFLMQNWEHVLHILDHLHLQPKESHGVDFSRVRMWTLNGWSKFYRQTILFSNINVPQINALFNKHCLNFSGRIVTQTPSDLGAISVVNVSLPHVFQRFSCSNSKEMPEARFKFFISKILPSFKEKVMSHTMIFVPSYFDFVRLRNHFRKEELSFTQICEYTSDGKIARARDNFYHSRRHFLLYTERFHFFRRYRIKGIRHVIFYELPTWPHFYSEICNFLHRSMHGKLAPGVESNFSCAVMYCQYDALQLASVVGKERASYLLTSEQTVHMFVTGED